LNNGYQRKPPRILIPSAASETSSDAEESQRKIVDNIELILKQDTMSSDHSDQEEAFEGPK